MCTMIHMNTLVWITKCHKVFSLSIYNIIHLEKNTIAICSEYRFQLGQTPLNDNTPVLVHSLLLLKIGGRLTLKPSDQLAL